VVVACGLLAAGAANAVTVTYAARSSSGNGNGMANATLGNYGGSGYGVSHPGENGSPQHAIDNHGRIDSVLVQFSAPVRLTSVTFGWAWSGSSNDTDFSVVYSTGTVPCLNAASYNALLNCGGGNSWNVLNNYNSSGTGLKNLGNDRIFARHWLVAAYGAFGSDCVGNSSSSHCDSGDDYFKLSSVGFVEQVPEPGSLVLLGVGLVGLGLGRRRRA
jgi:hypothetical protein